MGKSELQTSANDWQKRASKYTAAGIPQNIWGPIAQRDMSNTYHLGSAPMNNAEADIEVYSAFHGNAAVAQGPTHKSGILGALETALNPGNILSDVGGIITALPRGVTTIGKDLASPHQWEIALEDLVKGTEQTATGHWGEGARTEDQSALLNLVPGLNDLAQSTTPQGRLQLEEHPVTAMLDVAPAGKAIGAAAGVLKVGEEGSSEAAQALRAGQPLKAAVKAADTSLLQGRAGAATQSILKRAKLDADSRALSSAINRHNLTAKGKVRRTVANPLKRIYGNFTPDELNSYTQKIIGRDLKPGSVDITETMTPKELAIHDATEAWAANEVATALKDNDMKVPFGDKYPGALYPAEAPIVRAVNKEKAAANRLERNEDHLAEREAVLSRATQRRNIKVLQAKKLLDRLQAGGKVKMSSQIRMRRELRYANDRVASLERQVSNAHDTIQNTQEKLTKAGEDVSKKLYMDPPAILHPLIDKLWRQYVGESVKKLPPAEQTKMLEKIDKLYSISSLNEAFKDINKKQRYDIFEEYVGKEEADKLKADAIETALNLSEKGLKPIFLHQYPDSDSIFNAHIAAERDISEAQVRHRILNPASSHVNVVYALAGAAINRINRAGMQAVFYGDKSYGGMQALGKHETDILPAAEQAMRTYMEKGKTYNNHVITEDNIEARARELLSRTWTKFDFEKYGVRPPKSLPKRGDFYLPKEIMDNLESFTRGKGYKGVSGVFDHPVYRGGMRLFYTSVLFGPRHFAHVVIGGIMPLLMEHPSALLEVPGLWKPMWNLSKYGELADLQHLPDWIQSIIGGKYDYREEIGTKLWMQKSGSTLARWFQEAHKAGNKFGDPLVTVEDFAQTLYQGASILRDIKKGKRDPIEAVEHARRLVVNMDGMSPFERTILKQVFPFYTFTRFATKFLVRLPFDHPLRVAVLSQMANQARQEWGTGLPQTLMSLFFIGHPNASGNMWTVNFRNANPFRSLSNQFTLSGFVTSMNPALQAPFIAMGFNPFVGSGNLYPQTAYDPATGSLKAATPKGDWMMVAEQFVPELGAVDAYVGVSDNMRTLKAADPASFDRQLMNMLNIPFQPSHYNLPQLRGRVAKDQYIAAQQALSAFRKSGDYSGTIGKFNLVPYNGYLISPAQFRAWWEQMQAYYSKLYPGAATSAVIPKPPQQTTNTLAQLDQIYGGS